MRFFLLTVTLAWTCTAQDWEARVRALRPADTKAQETAVLDEVEQRARQSFDAIPRARTSADADRARPELRRRLRESLGFERLPWPPDLRARNVGTLERPGYRIEKIVWQTLPGVEVPAHLYLPQKMSGRLPGIIFYSGHWWPDAKTRPDFQAFCINMARWGFAVLAFDPFGQGERGQNNRDHRRVELLLAGVSQQGMAEYETRCAIEYLLSRKEVDPKRLGITGASGGGFNTWMTAALDERIAVAVPVVGTSEFYEQMAVLRPLDWYHANEHCHFVPGLMRYANNHELLAMAAPRPLMIIAASQDQSFPVKGVREVAQYGKELYTAYGMPEKAGYFEDATTGHGYQVKKREAAYGWFMKWLMGKGDGSPMAEPATDIPAFDAAELRCLPAGANQAAGPGIVAAVNHIKLRAKTPWPRIDAANCKVQLSSEPVSRVDACGSPAFVVKPQGASRGVLVALDDRGKEALAGDPVVKEALAGGWSVMGIDPRGIGERATTQVGWIGASSLLLGDWFVMRQAADVVRVLRGLGGPVALYGRGDNAALIGAVAVDQAPVKWFVLRDGFVSFRQFIDRPKSLKASYQLRTTDKARLEPYDREIPFFYIPFRALEHTDISEMIGRAPGAVVDPINGDWDRMSAAEARKVLPRNVRVVAGESPEAAVRELVRAR